MGIFDDQPSSVNTQTNAMFLLRSSSSDMHCVVVGCYHGISLTLDDLRGHNLIMRASGLAFYQLKIIVGVCI